MVIISMLTFKESLLLIEIRKLFFKIVLYCTGDEGHIHIN